MCAYADGEVLHNLVANIDMKDIRVNKLDAFVIPEKTTLYPGERFNANIVMAAVDTTQQPEIYVNGMRVNSARGQYSFTAGGVGEHQFSGYILMNNAKGDVMKRNFIQKYSVIPAPNTATVAADLMNVLYAGFQNPISISVPGVPANAISASTAQRGETEALRQELAKLREDMAAANQSIAKSTATTAAVLQRIEIDGMDTRVIA